VIKSLKVQIADLSKLLRELENANMDAFQEADKDGTKVF